MVQQGSAIQIRILNNLMDQVQSEAEPLKIPLKFLKAPDPDRNLKKLKGFSRFWSGLDP